MIATAQLTLLGAFWGRVFPVGSTAVRAMEGNASPQIPRFDMWTNGNPNVVC